MDAPRSRSWRLLRRHSSASSRLRVGTGSGATALIFLALICQAAGAQEDLTVDGTTVVLDGAHEYRNVQIINGGVLTHSPATADSAFALDLMVSGQLRIDATSRIDVSGRGYGEGRTAGNTPVGAATGWSGGSHGGLGAASNGSATDAYDDFREPRAPGAGAAADQGHGGAGGGAVRIRASRLTLDGQIRADGADGLDAYPNGGGGGAGGSIAIDAGVLEGGGTMTANGGKGGIVCYYGCRAGGSGGGGRIAVVYQSADGFDLDHARAEGGDRDVNAGSGAAGTVYLRHDGGSELRVIGTVRVGGAWTPLGGPTDDLLQVDRLSIAGAGVVVAPDHDMPVVAQDIAVAHGALLTHRFPSAETWFGLRLLVTGTLSIDAASAIDVSGRGYPLGRGANERWLGGAGNLGGGSYGGRGGYASNFPYGDATNPDQPGAGGAVGSGRGGAGGGLVRISAAVLALDGAIRADGAAGRDEERGQPAGSGGGVLINAAMLSGTGTVSADGGRNGLVCYYGCRDGGSGGGGRVAIYGDGLLAEQISAHGGDGTVPGRDGTVERPTAPRFVWSSPTDAVLHDVRRLVWEGLGVDPLGTSVDVAAVGATSHALATAQPWVGTLSWDTRAVADGRYELRATFHDGSGRVLGVASREVLVDNADVLHAGRISGDERWEAGTVHVVSRSVAVAPPATLTIAAGAVVKFAPRTGVVVEDGAALVSDGTAGAPVVLTSLADDAAAGDTNRDGGASLPRAGEWDGWLRIGSGRIDLGAQTAVAYARMAHSGTLPASDTWAASTVHEIVDDVVVPAGATLTLEPGVRVEPGPARGISLDDGAALEAVGTVAAPIVFTSLRDGSGDSPPEAGDWRWINVGGGRADLRHCRITYGGGTASGTWEETGVVRTYGAAADLSIRDSVVADAFFDGILVRGGTATVENVVLRGIDRAVSAHPGGTVAVTNCTLDDNRIGLLVHGGTLQVANTIVSHSYESGLQYDFGFLPTVRYSDIWSPDPGAENYRNLDDATGSNGNLSVDPRYVDRARADYRLAFLSPMIDAADGAAAPEGDATGTARYDDPRSPNSGTPTASGAFADGGAFEFVEDADSDIDLVVLDVQGPTQSTVGDRVVIRWTVHNGGTASVVGPWHDTIVLVTTLNGTTVEFEVADIEVAAGTVLAAGESRTFETEVNVPGAMVGDYSWEVRTNSHGDVFEGRHHANNTRRGSDTVSVAPAILPLDESVAGEVGSGGAAWYAFRAPFGTEYELELETGGGGGVALYARRGLVATADEYDWRTAPGNDSTQRLHIPGGPEDYVYVLVAATTDSLPAQPFSLRLTQLHAFDLAAVEPAVVCNAGDVTLQLRGSGFVTGSTVRLRRNGTEVAARSVFYADSTTLYATFAAQDLAAGAYDVLVRGERVEIDADGTVSVADLSAERPAALAVESGAGGRLAASLSTRDVQRAGRPFDLLLTYRNDGCADLTAPLLLVRGQGAHFVVEEEPFAFADTAQVMALSPTGPAERLRAGQQETIRLVVTPPRGASSFQITVAPATDGPGGPDLDAIAGFLGLPLDTAWGQAARSNLGAILGPTWASYQTALAAALADPSFGRRAPSVAAILDHLASVSAPPLESTDASDAPAAGPATGGAAVSAVPPPIPPGHTRFDPWPSGSEYDYDADRVADYKARLQAIAIGTQVRPSWIWGATHLQHFLDGSGTPLTYGPDDVFTQTLRDDPSFKQYLASGDWRKDVRSAGKALAAPLACGQAVRQTVHVVIDLPETGGGAFPGWLDDPGGQAIGGVDKAVLDLDVYVMRRENDIQVVGRGRVRFSDFYHWAGHRWYHRADYDPPWNWWACYIEYYGAARGFMVDVDFGDVLVFQESISGELVPRLPCDRLQFIPEPPSGFVVDEAGVRLAGSYDPNEKTSSGFGTAGWLRADPMILYTVRFENKSSATAPAQEVVVTDDLDAGLDWSTFALEAIGFNDRLIEVAPAHQSYTALTEVASDPNPVRVAADLDPVTGRFVLRVQSEDPVTRDLPADPFAGFLPPNDDEHHGEGFVSFTVKPRQGLADGTRIRNQARIVFDVNEPIDTETVVNTIGFPSCVGDCDGGETVSIDELIKGVNIALAAQPLATCAAFDVDGDGAVAINELIQAVGNALNGCREVQPTGTPLGPTRTVTPNPTRTATSTATSSPTPTRAPSSPPPTATTGPATPTASFTPTPTPTGLPNPHLYCDTLSGPLAIPDADGNGITDHIGIAADLPIATLTVRLQISHTWVGDLTVNLTHVDTLSATTLISRPGAEPLPPYGCGADDVDCRLDDGAVALADEQCASPPPAIGGSVAPTSPLIVFSGERSGGDWMLSVADHSGGDVGSLVHWCLEVR